MREKPYKIGALAIDTLIMICYIVNVITNILYIVITLMTTRKTTIFLEEVADYERRYQSICQAQ